MSYIVIPIFSDPFLHPLHKDNGLSMLYIKELDKIIDARINQFRSAVELVPQYFNREHAFKLTRLLEKVLHEEALKNPMEPKRQEKIIKDLRLIVYRLKPFLDEIRPLFISEKLKPL